MGGRGTGRRAGGWRWVAGGLLLGLMAVTGRPAGAAEFLLNTSTVAPFNTDAGGGFVDRVVAEAFARIGETGRVVAYPGASARALKLANGGQDDGVALRIAGLEERFPNLVRVPEKVMDNDFVAYSRARLPTAMDWAALESLSVAYILGWVIFEKNLPEGTYATAVADVSQLFGLLANRRTDVVLYERWQGLAAARDQGVEVVVAEPPLASVEMFMYLHQKHASLVPRLAEALRGMKADGTYGAIFAETLAPLVPAVPD